MKKFLVLVVFLLTMVGSSAQEKVSLGLRAGGNLSCFVIDNYYTTNRVGFHIGTVVDVPLTSWLYLQPGLYLTQKGAKVKWQDSRHVYSPIYLELPVLASFRYNFTRNLQVQLNVGPYAAYGMGGKADIEWGMGYSNNDAGDFFDTGANRNSFDAGVVAGAGVTFYHIYIGVQYERGLVNITKEYNAYNSNFSMSVGYNF